MNVGFDNIAAAAARLFLARGFKGVSLRAIAADLGIKAASLYHHCPGGKGELYVRAVSWFLDGYADRLLEARGGAAFPESLLRMAAFTVGQNHIDLRRIVTHDLPNLPADQQDALNHGLHVALLGPFVDEFDAARRDGSASASLDSHMAAACVLAIADNIGGLHLPADVSAESLESAQQLVRQGVSLLLNGTLP